MSSGWQTRPKGIEASSCRRSVDALARAHQAAAHLGLDQAGRDDVDVDAIGAQLVRQRVGERFHRGLAHVVGRAARAVAEGGDARDHDDVAALLLLHARDHQLAEEVGAQRVDADHTLELGGVGVLDALAAARDAGVVDQDVDVAEVARDRLHHAGVGFVVVDRAGVGARAAAQGLDGGHGLARGILVLAIVDGDVGAVLRERDRDGAADAAAAAGHQGDSSRERHRPTSSGRETDRRMVSRRSLASKR